MRGGSRWSRDLPQNSLNSFTNRSNVEEQRENTWVFKGEISPKIMADWCGRGGGLMASRGRFHGHRSWLQFRDESARIWWWIGLKLASKEAMIAPRSGHDRGLIMITIHLGCRLRIVESIPRWRIHDRGSIGPRSWCFFTSRLRRLIGIWSSRYLHIEEWIAPHRGHRMEIARSPCVHAVLPDREIGKECDSQMKIDASRWVHAPLRSREIAIVWWSADPFAPMIECLQSLHVSRGMRSITSTNSPLLSTCVDGRSHGLGSTRSMAFA